MAQRAKLTLACCSSLLPGFDLAEAEKSSNVSRITSALAVFDAPKVKLVFWNQTPRKA